MDIWTGMGNDIDTGVIEIDEMAIIKVFSWILELGVNYEVKGESVDQNRIPEQDIFDKIEENSSVKIDSYHKVVFEKLSKELERQVIGYTWRILIVSLKNVAG